MQHHLACQVPYEYMQTYHNLKVFVNILANWFSAEIKDRVIWPFSTWSRMKWWQNSICFVRECCTRFLVIQIALVLSHFIRIPLRSIPRSRSCCAIHKIWEQHAPATMYSALAVDRATEFSFLEYHEINEFLKN